MSLVGGTYSNKGGLAIVQGTFKVLKELGIDFKYIIDPESFFPFEFFNSYNLIPIYRYSDVLWKKKTPFVKHAYTLYPFIKCLINSRSFRKKYGCLNGSLLWYIGDSSLSDYRSLFSLLGETISIYSLKKAIKGKLIMGGISIEYPRTGIGKFVLRRFLKSVDYFFVRGQISYDNLTKLGVPPNKISLICDFSLFLEQEKEKNRKIENDKPTVALIFREYSDGLHRKDYIGAIKRLVSKLLEYDFKIFFIPMAYSGFIPENDLIFLENVLKIDKNSIININEANPEEIIHIFSKFDAVISARMHGCVYSALAGVPTIHLYEMPKSLELIKGVFGEIIPLFKLCNFARDDNLSNKIIKNLINLLQRKEEISYQMKTCIDNAKKRSINELKFALENLFE
jgi:polysaccharide pyruvyl transferase WcaK-like protein